MVDFALLIVSMRREKRVSSMGCVITEFGWIWWHAANHRNGGGFVKVWSQIQTGPNNTMGVHFVFVTAWGEIMEKYVNNIV